MKQTAPQIILAAAAAITTFDQTIAQLQAKLDAIPAQESEIAEDRSKSPADIREGLAVVRDRATDLRIEQKRAIEDRNKALKEAAAAFESCKYMIIDHFKGLEAEQMKKATAALSPFFAGSNDSLEKVAIEHLPAVRDAHQAHIYSPEKLAGETVEDRLARYCEIIEQTQLHKA